MGQAVINGIPVEFQPGMTILAAAQKVQVKIPMLCKHKDLPATASCGICVVKAKGSNKMLRACCTPIEEGMDIITHDTEIIKARRIVLELMLSNHPNDCLTCGRNRNCEFQTILADFGILDERFKKVIPEIPTDNSTGTIALEPPKCIKCGRCVEVCQDMQDVWALSFLQRGINTRISPAGDIKLADSPCVRCGQCSAHCPTGAIFEHDDTAKVWKALQDPNKYCVVQIAPAVRVAVGEGFGFEPGTNLTGKIYSLLRRLGFKAVFDTNFAADVTIMEEASEFVERFAHHKGPLPLITTCCPAWVDFMEKFQTDMVPHFSSAKSPQEMLSALAKTYYAEKNKIDPKNIFMLSIMPCTAKKFEIQRSEEMFGSHGQNTNISITTREFIRMIRQAGIDFSNLPDEEADHILGEYSGAGVIFGATGGVMEAALRTAYKFVTNENLGKVDFESTRGLEGIKESVINIKGTDVRIAVAHGLGNVEYVLNKVRVAKEKGEELPYHFIEVMACPGGCIGGGGQPYGVDDKIRAKRAKGLYTDDQQKAVRCSHDNPYVQKLYKEFLGAPLSEKSHDLLHTTYQPRPEYRK